MTSSPGPMSRSSAAISSAAVQEWVRSTSAGADPLPEPVLAAFGVGAVAGKLPARDRIADVVELHAGKRRAVERDGHAGAPRRTQQLIGRASAACHTRPVRRGGKYPEPLQQKEEHRRDAEPEQHHPLMALSEKVDAEMKDRDLQSEACHVACPVAQKRPRRAGVRPERPGAVRRIGRDERDRARKRQGPLGLHPDRQRRQIIDREPKQVRCGADDEVAGKSPCLGKGPAEERPGPGQRSFSR